MDIALKATMAFRKAFQDGGNIKSTKRSCINCLLPPYLEFQAKKSRLLLEVGFLFFCCQQWIVWILVLATLIVLGQRLQNIEPVNAQTSKSSAWTPYDESKLNQARAAGKSVFVDFTAAWCITCQVNKQTVLDTQAGQDLFRKAEVLLMRADWTRYDPVITEALSRLGRSSVPVYAFYPSDGSNPKMLPQILTMSMLEELFPSVKN
jgi:thiol:disulfide interchange protein